jgi:hypothetical protein
MAETPNALTLSSEEWESLRSGTLSEVGLESVTAILAHSHEPDHVGAPRVLAAMNFKLPDSDPRKITRERLRALKGAIEASEGEGNDDTFASAFVAALDSYLPPPSP